MRPAQSLAQLFGRNPKRVAGSEVVLEVMDYVDGTYVVAPAVRTSREAGAIPLILERGDRAQVKVTRGDADVRRDPYTGRILITPKGNGEVSASVTLTGVLGGGAVRLAGSETLIGLPGSMVPSAESRFMSAGGGACVSTWPLIDTTIKVDVRASVMANVIPRSMVRREINWANGMYFAYDPQVGFMRLTYNPDRLSRLTMQSAATPGAKAAPNTFFPGSGRNELYFVLDLVDLGITAANREPMVQNVERIEWPPFSREVMGIDRPLDFYDVQNPDVLVMRLESQKMQLYDYNSIDVENLGQTIGRDGRLRSRWRISNQADVPIRARWFALGDYVPNGGRNEGNRLLGPAKSGWESYEFDWNAEVPKSTLRQSISMNVVSVTDPIVAGAHRIDFQHPRPAPR